MDLLSEINEIKPVWIELGLQTINPKTAKYIRRGYTLTVFEKAVEDLKLRNIETIVHVILGLPGETFDDMLSTAKYLSNEPIDGIKFQMLHILEGTDLYREYIEKPFHVLTMDEYIDILIQSIEYLPTNIVIHRLTGDGPRRILVEPKWTLQKKNVLNTINREFIIRDTWQGRLCSK